MHTVNFVTIQNGCNWFTLLQKWIINSDFWLTITHSNHNLLWMQRWFGVMFWKLICIYPLPYSLTVIKDYIFFITSNNSMQKCQKSNMSTLLSVRFFFSQFIFHLSSSSHLIHFQGSHHWMKFLKPYLFSYNIHNTTTKCQVNVLLRFCGIVI